MEELVIKKHNFETAKTKIKNFSEEAIKDLEISHVESDKDFGEWFADFVCGRGAGLDHIVKGDELNKLAKEVQTHLIDINEDQKRIIKEFAEVYNALDALDKDYIQSILISVESARKANQKAKAAQDDIEKTVKGQKKIIELLQKFKEKLDKNKHLSDIDKMWDDIIENKKAVTSLSGQMDTLTDQAKVQVEAIWKEINSLKNNKENEENSEINNKIKLLFILVGTSIGISIIEFLILLC